MPGAVKKKPPKKRKSIDESLEMMTPENRATYEQFKRWQKGKEGLVDTVELIREIRGS